MESESAPNQNAQGPDRDQDESVAYFRLVEDLFESAARNVGGAVDRYFRIAGHDIRLSFAGPALVPKLTPALEHLPAPAEPSPSLTIRIWDSVSSGVEMPAPPWSWESRTTRGEIVGYNDERIRTSFQANAAALSMLDRVDNSSNYWLRDATQVPYYETGAPLRRILHWWLSDQGKQLIHAAALGTATGGILLVGQGGVGKSTTAISCIGSELLYASDDYCIFTNEPGPRAYSIYNTAKVDRMTLPRFPHLQAAFDHSGFLQEEKAVLFVWQHFPEVITTEFPIRALLIPTVTHQNDTRLQPASSLEGLRALAPSTMRQLAGAGQFAWRAMTALAKQVPSYHLRLGTDVAQIPPAIASVIGD